MAPVGAYLGMLVVWNYPPDQRFLTPVYPILFAGLIAELRRFVATLGKVRRPAVAVGILAVDNRASGRDVRPGDGPLLYTVGSLIAAAIENAPANSRHAVLKKPDFTLHLPANQIA